MTSVLLMGCLRERDLQSVPVAEGGREVGFTAGASEEGLHNTVRGWGWGVSVVAPCRNRDWSAIRPVGPILFLKPWF